MLLGCQRALSLSAVALDALKISGSKAAATNPAPALNPKPRRGRSHIPSIQSCRGRERERAGEGGCLQFQGRALADLRLIAEIVQRRSGEWKKRSGTQSKERPLLWIHGMAD